MASQNLITLSTSSATRVSPPGTHSGIDITIQNSNNSGYIYVGTESVSSTAYGYRLLPNHAISIELNGRDSLYAIASASGMKAAVLITHLELGA